ncbi:hypothetical protein V5O48_010499 [Marasmius crinis-equi]|uniref:F-box domain-containing protein n=1 Tax=Marasmius crinis-equi TaxID=585013 RepID=A0ABR3F873_9AGAR
MAERSDAVDPRFRSNDYIPSDGQIPLLRELLQEEMKKVEACKAEIDELQAEFPNKVKILEMKKQEFEDNIKACRSALSIHRRMPTELWRLIFSHACQPYSFQFDCADYCFDIDDFIEDTPALSISQVCSRWRQIMKSTPSLWSSVCTMITDLPYDTSKALQIHFDNAQDSLLDIRVVRIEDEYFGENPMHQSIWRIISQHLPRCRRLSLRLLHWEPEFVVDGLSFPHLESLQEEGSPVDRQEAFWRVIQNHAPRLTKAAISDIHALLPFSQLTSLDLRIIRNVDFHRLHNVLSACTRLEDLSLRGFGHQGEPPTNLSPIHLSGSLRKFGIYDNIFPIKPDNRALATFLTSARMPSLTCFEMRCRGWPASLAELARHSRLLERVKITIRPSDAAADFSPSHPSFAFFRALPELKHVEMQIGKSNNSVRGNGHASPESRQFLESILSHLENLPKLEHLSIRPLSLALDIELFEKVFEAVQALKRRSTPMPLKELRLAIDPALAAGEVVKKEAAKKYLVELEPAVAERIRSLQRDFGIKVVFLDGTSTFDEEEEPLYYFDDE